MANKYKKIKLSDGTTRNEHVLVMEEYLGRPLEPDECVHHCNEKKSFNAIENLELMLKTEHSRMHMLGISRVAWNKGTFTHGTKYGYERAKCRCGLC